MKAPKRVAPTDEPLQGPRPLIAKYELLYPACRVDGCDEPPEAGEKDCYQHVLVDAF